MLPAALRRWLRRPKVSAGGGRTGPVANPTHTPHTPSRLPRGSTGTERRGRRAPLRAKRNETAVPGPAAWGEAGVRAGPCRYRPIPGRDLSQASSVPAEVSGRWCQERPCRLPAPLADLSARTGVYSRTHPCPRCRDAAELVHPALPVGKPRHGWVGTAALPRRARPELPRRAPGPWHSPAELEVSWGPHVPA